MRILIRVKTNAKVNAVEQDAAGALRVLVKASPREGRANAAVIETLAQHFGVSRSRVAIIGGSKSKTKMVGINV